MATTDELRFKTAMAKKKRPMPGESPIGLEPDNIAAPGMSNLPDDPDGVPRGTIRPEPDVAKMRLNAAQAAPMTRTVGSNSIEKDRETAALGRDQQALISQLRLKSQMIEAAKRVGDLQGASRMQGEWDVLKNQRAQVENTGRDLALSKERSYVTPEGAQASHDRLASQLASPEVMANIERNRVADARRKATEGQPYQAPVATSSDPRTAALQTDARSFMAQAPLDNPGSDHITNQQQIDANRRAEVVNAEQMARAKLRANPPSMGPVADAAGINARYGQSADQAGSAEVRSKDAFARRKSQTDFQNQTVQNDRDIALANQNRVKTGNTIEDIRAQTALELAKGEAARAGYANQGANNDAELAARTPANVGTRDALSRVIEHLKPAGEYSVWNPLSTSRQTSEMKLNQAMNEIERHWSSLTPAQRAEYGLQLKQQADSIDTHVGSVYDKGEHTKHQYAERLRAIASRI